MDTPREVMFEQIATHWKASNKGLARAVVLHRSVTSGKSPLELIEVRSSLSRCVVHVGPGENVHGWIAPFDESLPRVMALLKRSSKPHSSADILNLMTGECARAMSASLDAYGQDGALYANIAKRIGDGRASTADAAETALALFIVAGCTGDAREAAKYTRQMMHQLAIANDLRTRFASGDEATTVAEGGAGLGLFRLRDGKLSGSPHRINDLPDGTEIGSMSLADHSINDVSTGVSRRHARIWKDEAGAWYVEDLGSTNGTVLVRQDGTRIVVGVPRSRRGTEEGCGQASLNPGERLILAGTTEFIAIELA